MAFTTSIPDVVVGVDFGMTSTGVAFSFGPEWPRPETIQHWPGTPGAGLADKVATALGYDERTDEVVNWGFMADSEIRGIRVEELFKLYLDPEYRDSYRDAPSLQEARRWFADYLTQIYRHVNRYFADSMPRWNEKRVDWVFSVPTTWKSPAQIADIENLIRSAGFGSLHNHNLQITLTEAEAAAVSASKNNYQKGDVFLVCDAGGGTTDVNVLKMASAVMGSTELEPLSWVEGRPIGSTLIDFKVEKLITERLESIRHSLEAEPRIIAQKMMKRTFESFKCNFGNEAMNVPMLYLQIPGLPRQFNYPAARIEDSRMTIHQEELQRIFDEQIDRIYKLVDEQLKNLLNTHAGESVKYLVLSGGLGSSPYVNRKLRQRYERGSANFPNAQNMMILKAAKPQLAVVHGLVMDRVQRIKEGSIVYKERCCRNSYGIIVRQAYNPALHQGEVITEDPRDKRRWAEKQIHWFIRQGQRISVRDGVRHHYHLKIDPGKERLPWKTHIVMSSLPVHQLPKSLRMDGVRPVCAVESVLNQRDMKLKNRHWYNFGPKYHRAEFDVNVIIGAADLKFQMIGKDGVVSKKHEEIEVQWTLAADPNTFESAPQESFGMYQQPGR